MDLKGLTQQELNDITVNIGNTQFTLPDIIDDLDKLVERDRINEYEFTPKTVIGLVEKIAELQGSVNEYMDYIIKVDRVVNRVKCKVMFTVDIDMFIPVGLPDMDKRCKIRDHAYETIANGTYESFDIKQQ